MVPSRQQQRFFELTAPVVAGLGLELWGLEYRPSHRPPLLRVFIESSADGESGSRGVSVEDCARVSCQLSGVLDVEDPLPGRYQLEISSPGMERRLFEPQHYQRFVGSRVCVSLRVPSDGQRNFTGWLLPFSAADASSVALRTATGAEHLFAFDDIEVARLAPEVGDTGAEGQSWS